MKYDLTDSRSNYRQRQLTIRKHSTETAIKLTDRFVGRGRAPSHSARNARLVGTIWLYRPLDLVAASSNWIWFNRRRPAVESSRSWRNAVRTQQIAYNGELSSIQYVLFGLPQGSVLGPLLYVLYTAELFHVVAHHRLRIYTCTPTTAKSTSVRQPVTRQPRSIVFLLALLTSRTGWRQADYDWTHPRLRPCGWVRVSSWTRSTSETSHYSQLA